QEFVIRSEQFGVPQSRHRVILLGVREDLWSRTIPALVPAAREVPISLVLQGLPKLRSGLSRTSDAHDAWRDTFHDVIRSGVLAGLPNWHYAAVRRTVIESLEAVREYRADRGGEFVPCHAGIGYRPDWFLDPRVGGVTN